MQENCQIVIQFCFVNSQSSFLWFDLIIICSGLFVFDFFEFSLFLVMHFDVLFCSLVTEKKCCVSV
jgi:hypothetical protein